MKDPKRTPWQCTASLCVRGSSPLLGDLLGVSRSVERDTLFVLLVYPRNFLSVLFVSFLIRDISLCEYPYYVFICVSCFGLVVSTY